MLKKLSHLFPLLLFIPMIFLLFSCTGTEVSPEEEAADTGILTNLYRETECMLPDGWWMLSSFPPEYDAENGTFTVCAQLSEEDEQEDGTLLYNYTVGFFTLDQNGSVLSQVTEPLPEHTQITHGTFTDDAVYCVTNLNTGEAERKNYLHRYDRKTGETISTAELTSLLDTGMNFPYALCTDADGDIYLASQEKIVILRPNLTEIVSIPMQNFLRSMASDRDGTVRVSTAMNGSQCIAVVNKDSGALDSAIPFTQTVPTLIGMQTADPDHVFYYLTDTFVWGMIFDEDGNPVPEAVMDLVNSGISNTGSASGASGVSSPTAVLDSDTILFAYAGVPLLYRHTDDIDLNTIRTITVAYAEPPNTHIMAQILEFNKAHSDVRVVTKDYSSYTTEDKPNGAEEQLTLELTTGLFRPDIIICGERSTLSEQIVRNNLYTDLVPYLETDDTVNFENLYGCIPRTFDDGKGGMWGIVSEFTLQTLIGHPETLGEYADKTGWTLDEMLDFFETLPDDVEILPELFQKGVYALLAEGYGTFVDMKSGTASFDSDTFLRYLNFLMTLPADSREWRQHSEYAALSKADQFYQRMSGKVALSDVWLSSPGSYWELETTFGTRDYVMIGLAATSGTGARISTGSFSGNSVYVITSFTKEPDTCFELVKSFFEEKQIALWAESGFFALKSSMETKYNYSYYPTGTDRVYYIGGSITSFERDPDNPLTEDMLDKPGIILTFEEEDKQKLEDFLDRAGHPLIYEIPDAVTDIVKEELSVLFGGLGTAEECAAKIQSRVTIWLSENE